MAVVAEMVAVVTAMAVTAMAVTDLAAVAVDLGSAVAVTDSAVVAMKCTSPTKGQPGLRWEGIVSLKPQEVAKVVAGAVAKETAAEDAAVVVTVVVAALVTVMVVVKPPQLKLAPQIYMWIPTA